MYNDDGFKNYTIVVDGLYGTVIGYISIEEEFNPLWGGFKDYLMDRYISVDRPVIYEGFRRDAVNMTADLEEATRSSYYYPNKKDKRYMRSCCRHVRR